MTAPLPDPVTPICPGICVHLSDYVDGEAAVELCAAIDAHLAECPNCRIVVDTLAQTVRLYHDLPDASLPPDAAQRLCAVLNLPAPSV